jgi:hypothetical protein
MVSELKDPKYDASARKGKRKATALDMDGDGDGDASASVVAKKKRNKQRVLLLSSRGITHRMRHLMNDLETLLPHVKKGVYKPIVMYYVRVCADRFSGFQIRSSTRRITSTCCRSLQIYTRVITRSTLRRVGTRTCTFGRPRHQMGQASSYMCRMSTRWTSSR